MNSTVHRTSPDCCEQHSDPEDLHSHTCIGRPCVSILKIIYFYIAFKENCVLEIKQVKKTYLSFLLFCFRINLERIVKKQLFKYLKTILFHHWYMKLPTLLHWAWLSRLGTHVALLLSSWGYRLRVQTQALMLV